MSLERIVDLLSKTLIQIGNVSISISTILLFFVIILLTIIISKVSRRRIRKIREKRADEDTSSLYILERFLHYFILSIGIIIALAYLGIDMSHLALLATALSVGLGFGLQSIFNNFFSGIIILLERSLKVGDFVELDNGVMGTVIEINVRSTTIRTPDNLDILVPNSEFVSKRVANWTLNDPSRRIHLPFGVAYGTDKELVKKAVLEAALSIPMTQREDKRYPEVWLVGFGESSLDFELLVWVDPRRNKTPGGLKARYFWAIETALNKYSIQVPFPQRDIHIKSQQEK